MSQTKDEDLFTLQNIILPHLEEERAEELCTQLSDLFRDYLKNKQEDGS